MMCLMHTRTWLVLLTAKMAAVYKKADYLLPPTGSFITQVLLCAQKEFPQGDLCVDGAHGNRSPAAGGITPLAQLQTLGGKMRIDISIYPLETLSAHMLNQMMSRSAQTTLEPCLPCPH